MLSAPDALPTCSSATDVSTALCVAGEASAKPAPDRTSAGTRSRYARSAVAEIAIQVAVFAAAGSYASLDTFLDGVGPALGACAALALMGATAGATLRARRSAPTVQVVAVEG